MTNPKEKDVDFHITARGERVEIVGASPFEMGEVVNTVPLPEVPTRATTVEALGFEELEQLTADSLQNDEERQIWAKYVKDRDAAERQRRELATNFMLLEGTRFSMEPEKVEAWKAKRAKWKLPIPEDEIELQIAYYRTAIIGSTDDLEIITQKVMARVGVDEATLKQVQSTFQHSPQGNGADGTQRAAGRVELQSALSGDEGSQGVGSGAAE